MKKMYLKGFSLIEVLIVIAIISILVAYALPAYRDYTVRAKLTEGTAMASTYKLAINEAYTRTGSLNGLNNETNSIPAADVMGFCVDVITVINGEITVDFDCEAGGEGVVDPYVNASQIVWTPNITASDSLVWTCSANVPQPDQNPCR